jgi:hypothetical protein
VKTPTTAETRRGNRCDLPCARVVGENTNNGGIEQYKLDGSHSTTLNEIIKNFYTIKETAKSTNVVQKLEPRNMSGALTPANKNGSLP